MCGHVGGVVTNEWNPVRMQEGSNLMSKLHVYRGQRLPFAKTDEWETNYTTSPTSTSMMYSRSASMTRLDTVVVDMDHAHLIYAELLGDKFKGARMTYCFDVSQWTTRDDQYQGWSTVWQISENIGTIMNTTGSINPVYPSCHPPPEAASSRCSCLLPDWYHWLTVQPGLPR